MQRLIHRLSQFSLLRNIVKWTGGHLLLNWWLERHPIIRKLPQTGVTYRARRLESIALAVEMLDQGTLYDRKLIPRNLQTFADIGCNAGYFACWVLHLSENPALRGLLIDANPKAVEDARWNAKANNLEQVHALHGVVGIRDGVGKVDFYVHRSNVCSTVDPPKREKGETAWTRIVVPTLRVEEEWKRRFGSQRCNLLKVDIEGSELDFFQVEKGFLDRVDSILMEWHKWRVELPELVDFLGRHGFRNYEILAEDDSLGTCFFSR